MAAARHLPVRYILDGGKLKSMSDRAAWQRWMDTKNAPVAVDEFGDTVVSTVFLGLDYAGTSHGLPMLWATAVFRRVTPDDPLSTVAGETMAYASAEDAEEGHRVIVARLRDEAERS